MVMKIYIAQHPVDTCAYYFNKYWFKPIIYCAYVDNKRVFNSFSAVLGLTVFCAARIMYL